MPLVRRCCCCCCCCCICSLRRQPARLPRAHRVAGAPAPPALGPRVAAGRGGGGRGRGDCVAHKGGESERGDVAHELVRGLLLLVLAQRRGREGLRGRRARPQVRSHSCGALGCRPLTESTFVALSDVGGTCAPSGKTFLPSTLWRRPAAGDTVSSCSGSVRSGGASDTPAPLPSEETWLGQQQRERARGSARGTAAG